MSNETTNNHIREELFRAIESALFAGWEPEKFLVEVRVGWAEAIEQQKESHMKQFKR